MLRAVENYRQAVSPRATRLKSNTLREFANFLECT